MTDPAAAAAVRDIIRPLLLQDLRVQCRARGLNPGGSRETLADRLADHMLKTGDREIKPAGTAPPTATADVTLAAETGGAAAPPKAGGAPPSPPRGPADGGGAAPPAGNNYARPGGQNVGNFLTDRPSSRVLAPPGGGSQITFG